MPAVAIGAFLPPGPGRGAWTDTDTFWWPVLGLDLGSGRLPSIERGPFNIMLELAGLAILVWAYQRFCWTSRPAAAPSSAPATSTETSSPDGTRR